MVISVKLKQNSLVYFNIERQQIAIGLIVMIVLGIIDRHNDFVSSANKLVWRIVAQEPEISII